MTVQGVDYSSLQASAPAMQNFKDAIATGIAEFVGVGRDRVEVRLSQGSVKVDATVTPPEEGCWRHLQGIQELRASSGLRPDVFSDGAVLPRVTAAARNALVLGFPS